MSGLGLVAVSAMMEDDDAEKYLRRTPFGKHGDDNKPCGSLEEEINAFYEFQYGVRVELKWNGAWLGLIGGVKIELKIEIGSFDEAKSKLDYHLKYLPKPNNHGSCHRHRRSQPGVCPGRAAASPLHRQRQRQLQGRQPDAVARPPVQRHPQRRAGQLGLPAARHAPRTSQ